MLRKCLTCSTYRGWIRFIECLATCPSTFDVEWSFLQFVWTCLSQSSNFITAFTCIFTYTMTTVNITLNPTRMCRNKLCGYAEFRFWVIWLIAWFDYFTLEIVSREASKVWTRYNGGKPGSYSTMHASVHENEMWNNILSARSSSCCHLQKVVYLRCEAAWYCLPLLVSTGSDPRQLGRACETTNGRSCLPTTYIYGRSL